LRLFSAHPGHVPPVDGLLGGLQLDAVFRRTQPGHVPSSRRLPRPGPHARARARIHPGARARAGASASASARGPGAVPREYGGPSVAVLLSPECPGATGTARARALPKYYPWWITHHPSSFMSHRDRFFSRRRSGRAGFRTTSTRKRSRSPCRPSSSSGTARPYLGPYLI
jgi:hypothetical protein